MAIQRFSVALCTYNGVPYLPAQLESILTQTHLPWEIVVCDDMSSDETLPMLYQFASQASFPVRIIQNEVNLRSTANFAKAISLCEGDVIVLVDQDDRWKPYKLSMMHKVFKTSPETDQMLSDADLIDTEGNPTGRRLWDSVGFIKLFRRMVRQGRMFEVLLNRYVITGATMAFRAPLRGSFMPIPVS